MDKSNLSNAKRMEPSVWKILQRSVFAHFLEVLDLHHNICPSVSTYILARKKTAFVLPCLVCTQGSWTPFVDF
jgi:hypothetical protein